MPWFQKLCRRSGLLAHDIVHAGEKRRLLHKDVQQRQVGDCVTLRRTTIDEVQMKPTEKKTGPKAATSSE